MAGRDVLFVHNNFPGQFGFVAQALRARGWRCAAIAGPDAQPGSVPLKKWGLRRGTTPGLFVPATRAEADMLRGRAALECARAYAAEGFNSELIIGHPGWGETLFLREAFPRAKLILHGEFYYHATGADVGFDPEFGAPDLEERIRIEGKNATLGLAYLSADRIVTPTPFQASTLPEVLRPRVEVIHEGVDLAAVRPRPPGDLKLPGGGVIAKGTPLITFINRNMEPLRGFHVFMRALPALLERVPHAHAVLIGATEGRGYGAAATAKTWKDQLMAEVGDRLDMNRVHFVGRVPHGWMLDALAASAAHVYLTYPFVLSWSLLEAMAMECLVVASDTLPVRDAVEHGETGVLIDFFDVEALSEAMVAACVAPASFAPLRKAARRAVVEHFDRATRCLPRWLALIDAVLAEHPRPDRQSASQDERLAL